MRPFALLLAVYAACGPAFAQSEAPPADPFAAAAAKVALTLYRPQKLPDAFQLGNVRLTTGSDPMFFATYYHPDGRQLDIMESSPEGLECAECATIDINGTPSPYEVTSSDDGTKTVDITVIKGKTAVVVGLRDKGGVDSKAFLLTLRPVAESLAKVDAAKDAAAPDPSSGVKDAAKQAHFAVYLPGWVPEYFYVKAAVYSPASPEVEGQPASPEQVAVIYADKTREIRVVAYGAGALKLPSGAGVARTTVGGWPAAVTRDKSRTAIWVEIPSAFVSISGDVQQSTLIRMARSLAASR